MLSTDMCTYSPSLGPVPSQVNTEDRSLNPDYYFTSCLTDFCQLFQTIVLLGFIPFICFTAFPTSGFIIPIVTDGPMASQILPPFQIFDSKSNMQFQLCL